MFEKCYKLKEIKGINKLNTNSAVGIEGIFEECFELEKNNELIAKINNKLINQIILLNIEKKEINIKFLTIDQKCKCTISCYNTDRFTEVTEKLYQKFPFLKFKSLSFICGGQALNGEFILQEKNIKDGDTILINDNDES